MRGSGSPLVTRRSSASDEGRRLVGSRPTRRYMARTASRSAGGARRARASASASGASSRPSRSTTATPSTTSTAGLNDGSQLWSEREAACLTGPSSCAVRRPRVRLVDVRAHDRRGSARPGGAALSARRLEAGRSAPGRARPGARARGRSSAGSSASRDGCRSPTPAPAAGRPGSPSRKLPPLKRADAAVGAPRALGEHDQRQPLRDQALPPLEDAERIGTVPIDEQVAGPAEVPAEEREAGRARPWR